MASKTATLLKDLTRETGMFLRNCWYVAAWEHELEERSVIGRQIIGEPLALYRDDGGDVRAVENRCSHRHAPLSLGSVEGDAIRCKYHGLLFGPDGRCKEVPGSDTIPPRADIRTFPVHIQDSWIWVWMGEPEKADPALCPKAFGLTDPRWKMRSGQIDYRAHYMLINDNLCDLSHVDFVHETTLGAATGLGWSEATPRVVPGERGVRIERWNIDKPASPNNPKRVDNWNVYEYLAPGIFIMETKSFPAGAAEESGGGAPTGKPMTHRIEQQAVTPIDERRTRYFFASGFDAALPEKLLDSIFEVVEKAFAEDREIIEAQQEIWDLTPEEKPKAFIVHDKAPHMFRRIMEKLIKAES